MGPGASTRWRHLLTTWRLCSWSVCTGLLLSGCGEPAEPRSGSTIAASGSAAPQHFEYDHNQSVVWAVNVGGPALTGVDGVRYAADNPSFGGLPGSLAEVIATQDAAVFSTYREGLAKISQPLPNGQYSIAFKFVEPLDQPVGSRVFDIAVEGQTMVRTMDVRGWRDGNHSAGLDHMIVGVVVDDGQLDIEFRATRGQPVLSALSVRQAQPDPRTWQLVWQDEFDVDGALDPDKWNYERWPAEKVNDELQVYTDRLKNVRVEDGVLIIEAHKEQLDNGDYTSGRVQTAGKGDLHYGRADIRARLPGGQGTWSAIWMMPTDFYRYATTCDSTQEAHGSTTCDAWPNSGEIDIMEYVGYDPNRIHATVHTKAYYWVNWRQRKSSIDGQSVEQAFHVYSIEWTPDEIRVLFDGIPYFFYANDGTGWESWPFDHPFHIILNLAIGGSWGSAGGPVDPNIFPARMEVDYVRLYQLPDQPEPLTGDEV